jgi:hypothetical protein
MDCGSDDNDDHNDNDDNNKIKPKIKEHKIYYDEHNQSVISKNSITFLEKKKQRIVLEYLSNLKELIIFIFMKIFMKEVILVFFFLIFLKIKRDL